MNNLKLLQVLQSIEQLYGESTDEIVIKSIEVVDFQELKQIHWQQLESHAQMLSENNIVLNMDHIHYIFLVVLPEILQYFELNTGLIVVFLLILNNLHRQLPLLFVVNAS